MAKAKGNLSAENKVFGKWLAAAAVLDKFVMRAADDIFGRLLFSCDERNYSAYMHILAAYGEIARVYDDSRVTSLAKEIWDGVYAVVTSRLDDAEGVFADISRRRRDCAAVLRYRLAQRMDFESIQIVADEIADDFRKNDAEYYELLQKERDMLGQIVAALETAAAQEENEVFGEAIEVLRKAQFSGGGAESPFRDLRRDFERFARRFAEKYDDFRKHADVLAAARLEIYHKELVADRAGYCRKMADDAVEMTREGMGCFGDILTHYDENKEYLQACGEKDIIVGVAETIAIKIEGLAEVVGDFCRSVDDIISGLCREKPAENQGVFDDFVCFLVQKLLKFGPEERKGAGIVRQLAEEFFGGEIFVGCMEKISKNVTRQVENLEKKTMAFMRDGFFFELSTFEEIMYYSVSRLRQSDDIEVLEFVAKIDSGCRALDGILMRYDIEKIVPGPRDPFNPRENEVLMAEENPEFKKGEIIKTMNAGYRRGEVVIVRANVIAAR
ncbi:MAG: nucleotide exchange factor GrpE [Defluviitaleaceae bacterium]|nr:nucleotide exchange factor GrpE [Defluviitaleaceae bacterium]